MNMVIPNEGKIAWLARALGFFSPYDFNGYNVRLYSNDYTPVDGSVFASFTDASFAGYALVNLGLGDFPTPTIVSDVAESTSGVTPVYNCTGGSPQTVYGWFLSDVDDNWCLAAQRFDTPRVMSAGAVESLDPFTIKLKSFA